MLTPLAYNEAVALVPDAKVPWPLSARLERTGDLISPADLADKARAWRRCPNCRDTGLLGNAIDRNLRFCGCIAGEELCYRDGASWPEQEIARVHQDTRSLPAAACHELQMPFAGDALARAQVRESAQIPEIVPHPWDARIGTITQKEMKRVLERMKWERTLVIAQPTDKQQAKSAIDGATS